MPFNIGVERGEETVKGFFWDYPMLSAVLTACLAESCPEVLSELTDGIWDDRKTVEIEGETYETYVDLSMAPLYYVDWPVPVLRDGAQVLEQDHNFYFAAREPDQRVVKLQKGDRVTAFRSFKN